MQCRQEQKIPTTVKKTPREGPQPKDEDKANGRKTRRRNTGARYWRRGGIELSKGRKASVHEPGGQESLAKSNLARWCEGGDPGTNKKAYEEMGRGFLEKLLGGEDLCGEKLPKRKETSTQASDISWDPEGEIDWSKRDAFPATA